jgi:HD-like signal output (HDOD) protein
MNVGTEELVSPIDRLLGAVDELHSSPAIVYRIVQALQDPDFDVVQVERLLDADPALATAVLRLVNSSAFGLRNKVGSLRQAIAFLGARSLRLVALSFGLVSRLTKGAPAAVCADYWRRALTIAAGAARLGAADRTARRDEAYSAGLLADLGVLVLTQVETARYAPLYQQHVHGPELVAAEEEKFGAGHPQVGERLLRRWNLPEAITDAVAQHHDAHHEPDSLCRLVYAGDLLADALWTPQTPRIGEIQKFFRAEFEIDLDGFIALAVECKRDILAQAEIFCVDLQGSIDCDAIRAHALRQYKAEALEVALDWDSTTSVLEQDLR